MSSTPQVIPQDTQDHPQKSHPHGPGFADPRILQKALNTRQGLKNIREKPSARERYQAILKRQGTGLDVVLRQAKEILSKARKQSKRDFRLEADLLKLIRDTTVDLHHLAHGKPAVVPESQQFTPEAYQQKLREIDEVEVEGPQDVVDAQGLSSHNILMKIVSEQE